jgi:hypothetical protein
MSRIRRIMFSTLTKGTSAMAEADCEIIVQLLLRRY